MPESRIAVAPMIDSAGALPEDQYPIIEGNLCDKNHMLTRINFHNKNVFTTRARLLSSAPFALVEEQSTSCG